MARHLKLRDDADAAIVRVGHELANLALRVIQAVGPCLLQLGKALALNTESLVVVQVPVQDIHLHRRHPIDIALEYLQRNEVAANVNQQAPPDELGLIVNRHRGSGKTIRGRFHQLKECLKAVQHAQRSGRGELRTGFRDYQLIRFILAESLHARPAVIRMNQQNRTGGTSRFLMDEHPRCAREFGNKSVDSAF